MRIDVPVKAAMHTDPVTHESFVILRKPTNHQTSSRLKNFQKCVAQKRRGQRAAGSTPAERAAMARRQQAEAARACAGGR